VREVVHIVRQGDICVVTLDAPPANAFGPDVRRALMAAICASPAPAAMVISSKGVAFSAALPLDGEQTAPRLVDLCAATIAAPFPIVCAVAGSVMGPGMELALACDFILAAPDAKFSLPEIALGLVPGGGATQTLVRRVPVATALDILLSGRAVQSSEALAIGLVDRVTRADLAPTALDLARDLATRPRNTRLLMGPRPEQFAAAISAARNALLVDALPASGMIIDGVEAALLLPVAQGLVMESTLREDLLNSDDVAGLRAAAESARIARRVPKGISGVPGATVAHLYLEGIGTAEVPLAYAALAAGIRVTLAEADRTILGSLLTDIAQRQDASVASGKLDETVRDADWSRLATVAPGPMLPDAVDAVIVGPGAVMRVPQIIAMRDPSVPCLVIGGGASDGIGLTLMPSGRLAALSDFAVTPAWSTARSLLHRIGMPAVVTRSKGGTPGEVVMAAGTVALTRLIAKGVRADDVEGALRSVQSATAPLPTVAVDRRVNGGKPLSMPRAEIIARWWSAMAAAGLDCLAAGSALCPADIDHLCVSGYGFPRRLGGPMHRAARRGLLLLRQDLNLWARDDRVWAAPPMLDRLIQDGRRLESLNPA
jgi:3-hydroxyacyl-CoA dehydrogenase